MTDHRLTFTYGAAAPIQVAVLDNGTGLHQNTLLPSLRTSGFHAESIASPTHLYRAVLTQPIAIAVLDTHFASESSFDVAQRLREISNVGIVMLVGWDRRQDSIKALHSGADLCLPKPIDTELLIATLQSLHRRLHNHAPMGAIADRPAAIGWQLQDDGWQLISPKGRTVLLTSTEQRIIKTLAKENGQLVLREALTEATAHHAYDLDPHRLEMAIHRLRSKVLKQTGEALPLKTVRGKGYLLTRSA